MPEDLDQVMQALSELKNQIKAINRIVSVPQNEQPAKYTPPAPKINDNYEAAALTKQELEQLLAKPPVTKESKDVSRDDGRDKTIGHSELEIVKKELKKLKDKQSNELEQIRKYIFVLSEMWGRHEIEIARMKKDI